MKTEQDIEEGIDKIAATFFKYPLSQEQTIILAGMVNALCWVLDKPTGKTCGDIIEGKLLGSLDPERN